MTLRQQQQQLQLKPKVIQHGDDDNDDVDDDEALLSSSSFCHRTVHSSSNNRSTSRRLLGIPSATSAAAAAATTTATTTTTTAYFSSSNSSTRTCNTNRHGYSTKVALVGTAVTLLLFVVLAVLYAPPSSSSSSSSAVAAWKQQQQQQQHHHRSLSQSQQEQVEDDNNSNNNNNNNNDYSHYSCHDIYDITPEPGDAQCAFGRTCNAGSGVWAPSVFCHNNNNNNSHSSFYFSMSTNMLFALYSPIMLLWMILLFRMLASTAEDFFSPALEMLSVKLGLPPRFAGVSLLALGNGAADVSATVSAITNDPAAGYQMATGALTGAAMFISAVVSAVVVFTADGVPCRGALVRDVCMLCLTAVLVFQQLHTTTVGPETMTLFLSLYMIFVVLVLVADIYHRTVVVPRLQAVAVERERMRQLVQAQRLQQQQEAAAAAAATAAGGGGIGTSLTATNYPMPMVANTNDDDFNNNMLANSNSNDYSIPSNTSGGGDHLAHFITALSNYDNQDLIQQQQQQGMDGSTGWGIESDDLARDRPIMLHGTHGILRGDGHLPSNDTTTTTAAAAGAGAGAANGQDDYHHYHHHGDYSMLHDAVDRVCVEPGSLGIPATNWIGALQDGQAELLEHASAVWEDIAFNADVDVVSKFLLICELPFTTLRKLTVPIPCEGYYVRALVALSMAISPLWFAYYLWDAHEFNILASSGWFYFLILWLVICLGALLVLRYAPGGEGSMALVLSTPIALYGFVIAATWIDTIADALVSVLDFVGIMLRIPGPIVGLTILAWGNSMGDLSANVTMARKGLGNMAMTACFAGPVFNILVGLGLGFGRLAAQTGQAVTEVHLQPSVVTGFIFLVLNSATILITGLVIGKGRINKLYGFTALSLYTVYVITSLLMQYTKGSGNSDGDG